jgi:hypothetical protein|tara:strand:+ start:107 stop:316 length:210 start_codon:yes stop_codon:yes gene_type:complete
VLRKSWLTLILLLTNLVIKCAQVLALLTAWILSKPLAKREGYQSFRKLGNLALLAIALSWTIQRIIAVL